MASRPDDLDRIMMTRCIALSRSLGDAGEYPYGAVIARDGDKAERRNTLRQRALRAIAPSGLHLLKVWMVRGAGP